MRAICPLRKACIILAPIFFLSWMHAQKIGDQVGPIASALRSEEFTKALDLVRAALKESSGNAQLWTMQGMAYSGEGRKKEALASFRAALKIAPDNVHALQGAAQIEYDDASPEALPLLKHLLRLRPDDPTSHGMLAVLAYQRGDCGSAVTHFEHAAALIDSKIEGLHAYAVCLVKLKRFDQAAQVFQRSIALEPDDKRERQLLASVQLMAQQPQSSVATLGPLLGVDDPDIETLELASAAYEATNDTERAIDALRRAILIDPSNVNLYLDYANICSVHQSFQVGLDVVNDGIGQQPKAAPLYFARGVLYVQTGQFDQAQADFEKAYELDPNQSLSAAAQGLAAVEANDLDKALTTVQAKLKAKPNDPTLLYIEADVLAKKEAEPGTPDFQLAMRSARKAIALRPTLGPAHAVLAKLYLQADQYSEAIEQCKKALEINPKDQTSLYRLIQALRKTENKNEVPALLKRLASIRQQTTKEEMEHYRYKLVEGGTEEQPAQP
jgi:tetratricopeptide (TPR) repeat protein